MINMPTVPLFQETHQADCGPQPSIVVCPPTLTGHWVYEVEKFVKKEHLNPLHYHGPPNERLKYVPLLYITMDLLTNASSMYLYSTLPWTS